MKNYADLRNDILDWEMVQQRINDAHEFACMADESLRPEAQTRSKRLRERA